MVSPHNFQNLFLWDNSSKPLAISPESSHWYCREKRVLAYLTQHQLHEAQCDTLSTASIVSSSKSVNLRKYETCVSSRMQYPSTQQNSSRMAIPTESMCSISSDDTLCRRPKNGKRIMDHIEGCSNSNIPCQYPLDRKKHLRLTPVSLSGGEISRKNIEYKYVPQQTRKALMNSMAFLLGNVPSYGKIEKKIKVFDSRTKPSVGVREYFIRLVTYFNCSMTCHLLALIYLERLCRRFPDMIVDTSNIHRLLLASTLCAAKFYDDSFLSNTAYAQIGGVSTKELNKLEAWLLSYLDFRLFVSPMEVTRYSELLLSFAPRQI
ncbi:putative Cyclin-U4-2 [Cardiosporidium cionae]|uniref:Cyclin-U4-2 n=1 Tax=Cardiosporidium cionae TaxID=476202 RepID=A0ABQ7JGA8_9APIC|nr:putative Cyclin-U4-2 [Cardiosporidium cionae]|eukprot:KAF8823029.1 putative Cyclin-U4-2 [Cardiosporidium cionae]